MDNINVVGNINNMNTTIIGTFKSGKSALGKKLSTMGYYLSIETLSNIHISIDEAKTKLNVDKFLEATTLQSKVVANIIDLVEKGHKLLVIDDLLTFVDRDIKQAIIKYLKEKEIRFINITSDIEDTLLTDYLIVMYDGRIALEGKTLEVLQEEKILKRLGFNLPFIVDLSIQLKYYGLVDKIYLDQEELVNILWKMG